MDEKIVRYFDSCLYVGSDIRVLLTSEKVKDLVKHLLMSSVYDGRHSTLQFQLKSVREATQWMDLHFQSSPMPKLQLVVSDLALTYAKISVSQCLSSKHVQSENEKLPSQRKVMDLTSILLVAGGCLALTFKKYSIFKKSKRKIGAIHKANVMSAKAWSLRQAVSKLLAIPVAEKQYYKNVLPDHIIQLDKGGLFVPRPEFFPFLRVFFSTLRRDHNQSQLRIDGKEALKAAKKKYNTDGNMKNMFKAACLVVVKKIGVQFSQGTIDDLFSVWTLKMIHAYMKSTVSGTFEQQRLDQGVQNSRGGLQLRDSLYATSSQTAPKAGKSAAKIVHQKPQIPRRTLFKKK